MKALENNPEPYYAKIRESIFRLALNPRPQGYKKLKGREAYRIRVADYRIIYEVFDTILSIDVVDIGHRSGIYD